MAEGIQHPVDAWPEPKLVEQELVTQLVVSDDIVIVGIGLIVLAYSPSQEVNSSILEQGFELPARSGLVSHLFPPALEKCHLDVLEGEVGLVEHFSEGGRDHTPDTGLLNRAHALWHPNPILAARN